MSTRKYTNVEVCEVHARLLEALELGGNKSALARKLGISLQTLKNREERGVRRLDDVKLLCNKEKLNADWVFCGTGPVRFSQQANGNGILQGHHIQADEIHIDVHSPGFVAEAKPLWRRKEDQDQDLSEIIHLLEYEIPEEKEKVLKYLRARKDLIEAMKGMGFTAHDTEIEG